MTGTHKTAAEMVDLYVDLLGKFPSIIAIIDPFRKEVQDSPWIFVIKHRIKISFFGLHHSTCVVIWTGAELLHFGVDEKRHLLSKWIAEAQLQRSVPGYRMKQAIPKHFRTTCIFTSNLADGSWASWCFNSFIIHPFQVLTEAGLQQGQMLFNQIHLLYMHKSSKAIYLKGLRYWGSFFNLFWQELFICHRRPSLPNPLKLQNLSFWFYEFENHHIYLLNRYLLWVNSTI